MIKSSKGMVDISGSGETEIMADLACIIKTLKEKFGEKNVREAVEFGTKSEKEIEMLLLEKRISILRGNMSKNDLAGGLIAAVLFTVTVGYIIFRLFYFG